jgi:hypothetical protein
MARKFGKKAAAEVEDDVIDGEAEELDEDLDDEDLDDDDDDLDDEDLDEVEEAPAPKKKTKAKAKSKAKKAKADAPAEGKTTGAPRARKWNYGIYPDSVITVVADDAPKGAGEAWEVVDDDMTVAEFQEAMGASYRHDLRVMMRAGSITLETNGQTYPQAYDAEAAEAARKAKAKAKAKKAAEEAAEDDEDEDEAPAPVAKKKRSSKKAKAKK